MNNKAPVASNKNKIIMNACFWAFLVIDVLWIAAVLSIGHILFTSLSE